MSFDMSTAGVGGGGAGRRKYASFMASNGRRIVGQRGGGIEQELC